MKFRNFDKYEVFEDGQIWSYKTNKFLKPYTKKDGYQVVNLSDNEGKIKMYRLHRVIYETFTGEPIPSGFEVNHLRETKNENSFESLNLLTHKDNIRWGSGIERSAKARSKQVGAYKNGELVMTFPSTMEAQRQGFNQGSVSACCNGKRKTHKGFVWRYI